MQAFAGNTPLSLSLSNSLSSHIILQVRHIKLCFKKKKGRENSLYSWDDTHSSWICMGHQQLAVFEMIFACGVPFMGGTLTLRIKATHPNFLVFSRPSKYALVFIFLFFLF